MPSTLDVRSPNFKLHKKTAIAQELGSPEQRIIHLSTYCVVLLVASWPNEQQSANQPASNDLCGTDEWFLVLLWLRRPYSPTSSPIHKLLIHQAIVWYRRGYNSFCDVCVFDRHWMTVPGREFFSYNFTEELGTWPRGKQKFSRKSIYKLPDCRN